MIPEVLGWTSSAQEIQRLSDRKETLYRKLLRQNGASPPSGVINWLETLSDRGILCAVASSAPRLNVQVSLEVLKIQNYFTGSVSGDDVSHGKPDPEVFLTATELLGISAENCVVFEDAHVGILAARAAQMKVVAIDSTHPRDTLHQADLIVSRLDELSISEIEKLFASP